MENEENREENREDNRQDNREENRTNTSQFFLSALSHEIRSPLNGIVGYTQLLQQTKLDSTQKMYVASMNQCCINLMELINDILDFSRLATGKMNINSGCLEFKEIINEVNSAIGYRIKEKKQKCSYILSDKLPEYIISDKQKIVQILINLISNANKFTDIEGRILVHVEPKDNNYLEFSVEDNGIGISPENQKRLFDVFFQVQESVSKVGSGLGLAICKKLVNILDGDISVESAVGQGSIFTFTIKYEPYETFRKKIETDSKILRGKHVLVVDDNVDNRLITGEMLFDAKIIPVICSSAKETLRMIMGGRYPFSVGLLDICMPDMSGTELASKIKETHPDLPLIALSSLDEPFDQSKFDCVLSKPINNLKLLDCLIKVIGKNDVATCRLDNTEVDDEEKIIAQKDVKILIAEDISYNLDMLIKMLQSMGYRNIDTAIDGEKAIEKIDREYNTKRSYDILLLDLKMPKVDGFTVAKHLNDKGYEYPKTAVITASVVEEDREKCRKLGIKYFILKPINMSHLKTVLKYMSSETGSRIEMKF